MQTRQLLVNEQQVDLPDGQPIALTFQVNDLAELKDRQSTFSNTINLPLSATNKEVFGYGHDTNFVQTAPYKALQAKYIQNGVEIVPVAKVLLNGISGGFDIVLMSGLRGFSEIIGDTKLTELPFEGITLEWTRQAVADSQTNTWEDGFVWSLINYGISVNRYTDIRYIRPLIFARRVMMEIEKLSGYSFQGAVIDDPIFATELIATGTEKYAKAFGAGNPTVVENLPDVSIKAFLKDFMQRYFLTPVVDNERKTITFQTFDNLYFNLPRSRDWTDKFVRSKPDVKFALNNYGQINYLNYKADDTVAENFGQGTFAIENENLNTSVGVAESIFAATENLTSSQDGFSVASITTIKDPAESFEFKNKVQPRVLYNYKVKTPVYYFFTEGDDEDEGNVGVLSVSVPYFSYQDRESLSYADLLNKYGKGFMRLLKKVRVETKSVTLDEVDVKDFDFFIPVYDRREGVYYYVNKIKEWQPGRACEVQLIKM